MRDWMIMLKDGEEVHLKATQVIVVDGMLQLFDSQSQLVAGFPTAEYQYFHQE